MKLHVQSLGYLLKAARSDPVRASFVLLYLLKCHPDGLAERRLRHLLPDAPLANSTADMNIHRVVPASLFLGVNTRHSYLPGAPSSVDCIFRRAGVQIRSTARRLA